MVAMGCGWSVGWYLSDMVEESPGACGKAENATLGLGLTDASESAFACV